jgi:hypothetical protein
MVLPLPGGDDMRSTGIRYFIHISRYSRFYMLNLVYPMTMMVVLSWLVFFTPITKSDRLAYSVTLLLAAMAVQFITADKRPAEANDGWIDRFMTGAYILIIIPIVETSILFRLEASIEHQVDQSELEDFDPSVSRPIEKGRINILASGHSRIRMIDRMARVMYPILIALFGIIMFGPASPFFETRHEQKPEVSLSVITLVVFSVPLFALMFWFSLKSWINLGPHTRNQLTSAFRDALTDPRDALRDELVDSDVASKDSDDEQSSPTYINRGPPWSVVH